MGPHRRRHHPRGHDRGADEGGGAEGVQGGGWGVAWVPDVAWQQSAFSTSTEGRGKKVAAARGAVERLNEPGTQVEADLAVLPIGAGATASAETCRAHGKPRGKPADSSSQLSMCLAGLLGGGGRGPGQTGGRSPATSVDRETSRSPRLICWMGVGGRGPADVDLAVLLSHNNVPETALTGSRGPVCKDLGERRTGKRVALWVAAVSANGPGGALHPLAELPWGPWLVDIEMVSAQSAGCMALTTHHLLLTVNSAKVPTTSPASVARQGRLLGRGSGGCWGLVRS